MRKLLSAVLAATMVMSMTACGGSQPAATTAAPAAPAAETKAEETKAEESKAEETKAEETKAEETKAEAAPAAEGAVWKIGGIGPITGGAAVYGLSCMNAQQLAVDEINANGGINGYQIEFKFADDEHDAEKSVNAYNSLKDWGMHMLLGCTTSAPCIAVSAPPALPASQFPLSP